MRKKSILKRISAAVLAACLLAGCGGNAGGSGESQSSAPAQAAQTADPGTITMAMVSAWDTFMPFDTSSTYSDTVFDLIFDRLAYLKQDGTYTPRLADSWEMSEDNKVLTIHLNENAKWQDGEPVTAEDVVFTSKLYASEELGAVRRNTMNVFAGFDEGDLAVEALDDHTVQFTCAEPTNIDYIFYNVFKLVYILPSHLLGNLSAEELRNSDYWKAPVGSGPCIYKDQISGERVEFEANKDYFLKSPSWDRLVLKVVATQNLLSGLMNHEIDILAGDVASLPLSDWDMATKQEDLVTESQPSLSYQYMAINTSKDYLNEDVRQAISLAINREAIVTGLLKGEGEALYGPFSSRHAYYNPEVKTDYDPEKAKELLAKGGWDGSHELVFSVPTGNSVREQAAVIIQQNLQEIGIKTRIDSADFSTHLNRVRQGDYDLGLVGSSGSPDPAECVVNFKPDGVNNFAHVSDSSIYDVGEQGQHVFSKEERKEYYDEYQVLLRDQVPFCFLYSPNNLFAYNKRLSGITDSEDYSQRNRDVWNWSIQ